MINWIREQLTENEFAAGGLLVILGSSILYLARSIPSYIWRLTKRYIILEIEIRQPDPLYDWISEWIKNIVTPSRLSAITIRHGENSRLQVIFIPGIGNHLFRYNYNIFLLQRERDESTSSENHNLLQRESYFICGLRNSRKAIIEMFEIIRTEKLKKEGDGPDIFIAREYGNWDRLLRATSRSIESVILKEGLAEIILEKCKKFFSNQDQYIKQGVPWRLGILLYGPPGNGKTSLISALAHELNLSLGILNLATDQMSDNSLLELLGNCNGMIVSIEDVDSLFDTRTRDEVGKSISFSGLLNAIDGIAAGSGRIIIMTTNNIERLDSALIRRGRIDICELIDIPDENQLIKLWEIFESKIKLSEFVEMHIGKNMSDAQNTLLEEK